MWISLVQISLLQFFKTFQVYLANTIFDSFYFITAIFEPKTGKKRHKWRKKPKKRISQIAVMKQKEPTFALAKYMPNVNFG